MVNAYVPKFKIDDIVFLEDNFSSNPAYRTIFIGQIQSIHIHRNKGILKNERSGIFYDIKNYSLGKLPEEKLKLYKGKIF